MYSFRWVSTYGHISGSNGQKSCLARSCFLILENVPGITIGTKVATIIEPPTAVVFLSAMWWFPVGYHIVIGPSGREKRSVALSENFVWRFLHLNPLFVTDFTQSEPAEMRARTSAWKQTKKNQEKKTKKKKPERRKYKERLELDTWPITVTEIVFKLQHCALQPDYRTKASFHSFNNRLRKGGFRLHL